MRNATGGTELYGTDMAAELIIICGASWEGMGHAYAIRAGLSAGWIGTAFVVGGMETEGTLEETSGGVEDGLCEVGVMSSGEAVGERWQESCSDGETHE